MKLLYVSLMMLLVCHVSSPRLLGPNRWRHLAHHFERGRQNAAECLLLACRSFRAVAARTPDVARSATPCALPMPQAAR